MNPFIYAWSIGTNRKSDKMIKLIILLMISSLNCSYLFVNYGLSSKSTIKYDNSLNKSFNTNLTLGYAHTIIDESYFKLYAGFSYTLIPTKYNNNNIYSSNSDNGIIVSCEDIINPKNTELYIGHIFFSPEYKFNEKFFGWISIGVNLLDINYLQLFHSYQLWSLDSDGEYYEQIDECVICAKEFPDVNSYGGVGLGLGLDYMLPNNMMLSFGKYLNSSKNIDGYDKSLFEYVNIDFTSSSYFIGLKYRF